MEKMMQKHKKAMDNGGFSLVELIIVIAILAVLVALVAPQYFQYVEKSRKAVDVNTAAEILQATKVAAIDPDVTISETTTVTWELSTSVAVSPENEGLQNALNTTLSDLKASKSNFATTAGSFEVTINIDATTQALTFTVNTNWAEAVSTTPTATTTPVTPG